MSDLIDLAERLEFHADCSDMGRKPDPSSVTRRAAKALRKAATLEAKLAERDAMIIKLGENAATAAKEYSSKLAVAREALEPFATVAEYAAFLEAGDADYIDVAPFIAGQYRAAHAAIKEIEQ